MRIVGVYQSIKAMFIPIIITVYCVQEEEWAPSQTPFGTDASRIAGVEAGFPPVESTLHHGNTNGKGAASEDAAPFRRPLPRCTA